MLLFCVRHYFVRPLFFCSCSLINIIKKETYTYIFDRKSLSLSFSLTHTFTLISIITVSHSCGCKIYS